MHNLTKSADKKALQSDIKGKYCIYESRFISSYTMINQNCHIKRQNAGKAGTTKAVTAMAFLFCLWPF